MKHSAKAGNKSRLILIGPFPPPVHGMAMVNQAVYRKLAEKGAHPVVINTSPGRIGDNLLSRLSRLPCILRGWLCLLLHVIRSPGGNLYLSVSGGIGQVYESLFVFTARAFGWNLILHHHSYAYLDKSRWLTKCLFGLAGRGAIHVVLCNAMGRRLKRVYRNVYNTTVLSNISFLEEQYVASSIKRTQLRKIGFLSNISESKGILEFLDIAEKLENCSVGVEMVIAGAFASNEIEAVLNSRLATLSATSYLGPLYGEEKKTFFDSIDVLLFPTKYFNEAEPLTIYEALCSSVPVIARGRGCISSIVDERFGLVVDRKDDFVLSAINKILAWLESPDEFSTASQEALKYAEKKSKLQRTQMESLCEILVGNCDILR